MFIETTQLALLKEDAVSSTLFSPGTLIALVAWYVTAAPPGQYVVRFNGIPLKNTFFYEKDPVDWVYIDEPLQWTELSQFYPNASIILQNSKPMPRNLQLIYPYTNYAVKPSGEVLIAIRKSNNIPYKPEPKKRTRLNPFKCLTVTKHDSCPKCITCKKPVTFNRCFDECIQWMRTDGVGHACNRILPKKLKTITFNVFCNI